MTTELEARFDYLWRALEGPALEAEYLFQPTRRWRFDRAHPEARVAIEIEGGPGRPKKGSDKPAKSRHTEYYTGYTDDCIKYNTAQALGWYVFRLTSPMLNDPAHLEQIITTIRQYGG